jgi:hypothetical protein
MKYLGIKVSLYYPSERGRIVPNTVDSVNFSFGDARLEEIARSV